MDILEYICDQVQFIEPYNEWINILIDAILPHCDMPPDEPNLLI